MSLQPTNIPQLQNMGLTPAANMVNTGISAMISAREGGRDRRNKLLQALLGGAVDVGVQGLRNEGNLAMTEAQLKSPAQLALAVNRLATGAASPDQAGAIRDRVNRILGDIPGTGEEGQAPILPLEGSPVLDQVGGDAVQTFGGQGGVTGVPQGQEFAQSPSGAFQLGTQQQVASASPSYGMDLPLGMARQQAKIERDLAGKSLSEARENKVYVDTDRSKVGLKMDKRKLDRDEDLFPDYGALENSEYATSLRTKQPFKIKGRALPNSTDLNLARQQFRELRALSKQKSAEQLTNFNTKLPRVQKLAGLLAEGRALIGTNVGQTFMNKIATDPNILLTSNDPVAAKMRQIEKELRGIVGLQLTTEIQGSRPTDYDAEKIDQTLPSMFMSKENFDFATQDIMADLGGKLLDEALIIDRPDVVTKVGPMVEELTKRPYSFQNPQGIGAQRFNNSSQVQDLRMQVLEELREEKQRGF